MPDIEKIKGFSVEKLIGKGSYGKVYLCRASLTKRKYAAKIVDFGIDHRRRWQAENEIEVLKELANHQSIVNIYCTIRESHRNIIILECLSEITFLRGILFWPNFSEHDASLVMKQLLSAVQFCHSRRIVHRDLRPDNILWVRHPSSYLIENTLPQLKVIDFNLARKISDTNNFVYVRPQGDPTYMSPECLNEPSIVTFSCDVWSVGVLLYTLFAGYPPFMDYNYDHLLLNVLEGNFVLPEKFWNHVSPIGKDFMMKMLESDYMERWSAKEMLSHAWLFQTKSKSHTMWPGQYRLKEFFQYLDDIKKRDNHRQFKLTAKERKAFIPDETMISSTNTSKPLHRLTSSRGLVDMQEVNR